MEILGFILSGILFLICFYLKIKVKKLRKKLRLLKSCNDYCNCNDDYEYGDEEFWIPVPPQKRDPINFSYHKISIPDISIFEFKKPVEGVLNFDSGFEAILNSYEYYDKFLEWNNDTYHFSPFEYKKDIILINNNGESCILKGCFPTSLVKNNKNSKKMKVTFSFDAVVKL